MDEWFKTEWAELRGEVRDTLDRVGKVERWVEREETRRAVLAEQDRIAKERRGNVVKTVLAIVGLAATVAGVVLPYILRGP